MPLQDYFDPSRCREALDAYKKVAPKLNWSIAQRVAMYGQARVAFDAARPAGERHDAYALLFKSLRDYWKVTGDKCEVWNDPEALYARLMGECGPCAWDAGITLLTLRADPGQLRPVRKAARALRSAIPRTAYPVIAAAKCLHFLNPALFPFYEGRVMWDRVCNGLFRREYRAFCESVGRRPPDDSAEFMVTYTRWAAECIAAAGCDFMRAFATWLREAANAVDDPHGVLADAERHYATAFEFIVIGASELLWDPSMER